MNERIFKDFPFRRKENGKPPTRDPSSISNFKKDFSFGDVKKKTGRPPTERSSISNFNKSFEISKL